MGQRSLHGRSSPELEQLQRIFPPLHRAKDRSRFAHRKQTEIKTIWEPQCFTRRPGEALHPEREPLATLEMLRRTLGEYHFLPASICKPLGPSWRRPGEDRVVKRYGANELPPTYDRIGSRDGQAMRGKPHDDRDMLQEMRMVLRAHRVPGMDDDVPTPAQVFRMATSGGAKTTPFADTIGALEVGRAADIVLIDWRQIAYPYLDTETPLLDAVLQRAKTSGVRTVICDGEVIYDDGKFTKVDRDSALRALHDDLQRALSDDEVERRGLAKSLLPHVRAFYANYFDSEQHVPFYRQSSRR